MTGTESVDDSDAIDIITFQKQWGHLFRSESESIGKLFPLESVQIEHIGSTAVNGLAAKPVIDIMLGIDRYRGGVEFDEKIQRLGYVNVAEPQQLLPNTRFFLRRDQQHRRSHHLHLVALDSKFWHSRLSFRDFLRQHVDVAHVYGELKKMGAQRHRYDRQAYNAFKESFIKACLKCDSDAL